MSALELVVMNYSHIGDNNNHQYYTQADCNNFYSSQIYFSNGALHISSPPIQPLPTTNQWMSDFLELEQRMSAEERNVTTTMNIQHTPTDICANDQTSSSCQTTENVLATHQSPLLGKMEISYSTPNINKDESTVLLEMLQDDDANSSSSNHTNYESTSFFSPSTDNDQQDNLARMKSYQVMTQPKIINETTEK